MPIECQAFGEPHVSFELRSAPGYFGVEWLNDFATTFKTLLEQIAEGGGEQNGIESTSDVFGADAVFETVEPDGRLLCEG